MPRKPQDVLGGGGCSYTHQIPAIIILSQELQIPVIILIFLIFWLSQE